jgi:hypothetical protein
MKDVNEIKQRLAVLSDAERSRVLERLSFHLDAESDNFVLEEAVSAYGTESVVETLCREIVSLPINAKQQLRDWLLVNLVEETPEMLAAIAQGTADFDSGKYTIVSRAGLAAMARQWAGESR